MKTIPLDLLVDETFDGTGWHGANLRTSLLGVDTAEAAWRPGPGRPGIWHITLHCAYWKHRVWQRVTGLRTPFPRPGRDWPRPETSLREDGGSPDEDVGSQNGRAWARDRRLLHDVHGRLVDAVRDLGQADLEVPGPGQKRTRAENLAGIMLHDTYHAGQIRLLRKLYGMRS